LPSRGTILGLRYTIKTLSGQSASSRIKVYTVMFGNSMRIGGHLPPGDHTAVHTALRSDNRHEYTVRVRERVRMFQFPTGICIPVGTGNVVPELNKLSITPRRRMGWYNSTILDLGTRWR
jgi:hypothetical protein